MYLNSGSIALLITQAQKMSDAIDGQQDIPTDEIGYSTDLDHDINSLGTK